MSTRPPQHYDATRETRFALISACARSAIATIWIGGPRATECMQQCFTSISGKRVSTFSIGAIHYGRWKSGIARSADEAISSGEPAVSDDQATDNVSEGVVVCRTDVQEFEVHCHGGIAAQLAISSDLAAQGLTEHDWNEYTRRFARDTIQAEATTMLRIAKTDCAAAILLDQHNGALQAAIQQCIVLLEGPVDPAQRSHSDRQKVSELIDGMISNSRAGMHLIDPFRIVVAGRPNVGKSSLINRLLGFERAIVFDQPGTTRDVVRSQTAFAGWPAELSDTAGLRHSDDAIESAGVNRAKQELAAADLVVLVFDWSSRWTPENQLLLDDNPKALTVFNKTDLPPVSDGIQEIRNKIATVRECLSISATTGAGLAELIERIGNLLVPEVPCRSAPVPFTDRQIYLLQAAGNSIARGEPFAAIARLNSLIGAKEN